jgi:hypothetical protein
MMVVPWAMAIGFADTAWQIADPSNTPAHARTNEFHMIDSKVAHTARHRTNVRMRNAERQAIGGRSGGRSAGDRAVGVTRRAGSKRHTVAAGVTTATAAKEAPWNAQPAVHADSVHSSQWQHAILAGLRVSPLA